MKMIKPSVNEHHCENMILKICHSITKFQKCVKIPLNGSGKHENLLYLYLGWLKINLKLSNFVFCVNRAKKNGFKWCITAGSQKK